MTDLARLLLEARRELAHDLDADMAERGYPELRPAHTALFLSIDRRSGSRLVDLAEEARVTKQAMMAIVDDLEWRGYVRRIADPTDTRAKLVRLTTRGRSAAGGVPACGAVGRSTDEATPGGPGVRRARRRAGRARRARRHGGLTMPEEATGQVRRPERAPTEARTTPRPPRSPACLGSSPRSCTCRTSTRTPPEENHELARRFLAERPVLRCPRGLGDRLEAVAGQRRRGVLQGAVADGRRVRPSAAGQRAWDR